MLGGKGASEALSFLSPRCSLWLPLRESGTRQYTEERTLSLGGERQACTRGAWPGQPLAGPVPVLNWCPPLWGGLDVGTLI